MLEFPRTQGFLYCITLKFGVYIICSFDVFSSIFVCISLGLVLLNPNILAQTDSRSDILWTSPESMPSLRAHLLLAAITLAMGVVGMMGVRSVPTRVPYGHLTATLPRHSAHRSGNTDQLQALFNWQVTRILLLFALDCVLSRSPGHRPPPTALFTAAPSPGVTGCARAAQGLVGSGVRRGPAARGLPRPPRGERGRGRPRHRPPRLLRLGHLVPRLRPA